MAQSIARADGIARSRRSTRSSMTPSSSRMPCAETPLTSGRGLSTSARRGGACLAATRCASGARVDVDGAEPAHELVTKIRAAGIAVADGTAWDDAFFAAFLDRVDPVLAALDHAIFLVDWPTPLAALARRKDGDPKTALRFEAYVGGIELANAFDELIDPTEQRARFADDQRIRAERGKPVYPLDEKLLAALAEGLPPSAGVALGFDRLVMLATGAGTIADVLTFVGTEL
jgi:elongation factor P--beta-lysine ligase